MKIEHFLSLALDQTS